MNKKLLGLAIAGVLATPFAAQAGVEVYGKINLGVGLTDNGAKDGDSLEMTPNNSNVGFRGDEDLGNGMSAIYQAETALSWDTGGWGGGRNTYVGFKSDAGKLIFGRHDSPYKLSTGRMDPFSDTQGDYNSIMGVSPSGNIHDMRIPNSIMYTSPNLSGFTVMGSFGVNDRRNVGTTATVGTDDSETEFSLGATYNAGPLFVGAGWQSLNEQGDAGTGTTLEDDVGIKVGAGFTLAEATTFSLIWENLDAGGSNRDRDGLYGAIEHKMGSNTIALTYAMADDVGNVADSAASQIALGAYHAMSKATSVYALYSQLSLDRNSPDYSIFGSSMSSTGGVLADESGSAIMLGVLHTFSSK